MTDSPAVVAHMIVGWREEPYLEAALASIAHSCDHAVINDNSGREASPHAAKIARCAFAREGRLTLVRSPFVDFAQARNACIDATPDNLRGGWALFIDADEVHAAELAPIVALLSKLPSSINAVDGYSRHFVGSFGWWHSIQRRLCFFRLSPQRRWSGAVHERLHPRSVCVALPALWFHYGHVVTPRMEAEKGRLYSSLGQSGAVATDEELSSMGASVWNGLLRDALRFAGEHPVAAQQTIATLTTEWSATFAEVDAIARAQSGRDHARNWLRARNYERLLLWRAIEARLRWGWR